MLPSTCIVVPTYWTRGGAKSQPNDAVYDHPTPIDGRSTLPALLDSLAVLDASGFYLLLLVAVTGSDVASAAEEHVRELAARYPGVTTLIFGPSHLTDLRECLEVKRLAEVGRGLDLLGYPRIRNLQLAIPHALGAEAIVALDDDEIVTDPRFLEKVTESLGSEIDGHRVDGLSGYYTQETGGILLGVERDVETAPNLFDRKAAIMNAGTDRLQAEPEDIVLTPFCFGGNMHFTRDLAATVAFDPGITRGEDIDYLINARMEGRSFFLRKDLRILHRPPAGGSYKDRSTSKLEQDVERFIYDRHKVEMSQRHPDLHAVTADELMPYPGDFLTGDIEGESIQALTEAGFDGDAALFVQEACESSRRKFDRYLDFRLHWPALIASLAECPAIRQLTPVSDVERV